MDILDDEKPVEVTPFAHHTMQIREHDRAEVSFLLRIEQDIELIYEK